MNLSTRFPEVLRRPETPATSWGRHEYITHWARSSGAFLAPVPQSETGPLPSMWSFKIAFDGQLPLIVGRRRLVLSPGLYLRVNAGQEYAVQALGGAPVRCLGLHVRDELACALARDAALDWPQALEPRTDAPPAPLVREQLCVLDEGLQPWLIRLCTAIEHCSGDAHAVEADFIALVVALLRWEQGQREHAQGALKALRLATREELVRRIGLATDFIHSNFSEPIGLDDIAGAAHLSKFHLLRAFCQLHRCTPHQFLLAQRVRAAQRVLNDESLSLDAVALGAGFGSRWSMQRALRDRLGASGRTLRRRQLSSTA
jgi:AraC family transcriptional regulator